MQMQKQKQIHHLLQCTVCYNDYNRTSHIPKSLPCGHSVCSTCLFNLLRIFEPKCPFDKANITPTTRSMEEFPTNYALMSLVEENLDWSFCQIHRERLKLVCINEKRKLCPYCMVNEDHTEHNHQDITTFVPIVIEKKQKLELVLSNIKDYYNDIHNTLQKARENLQKISQEKFSELFFVLQSKKLEFSEEIDSFFAQEKLRATQILGEDSILRSSIKEKIGSYIIPVGNQDLNNLFESEQDDFPNLESWTLKELIAQFNEKLTIASHSFVNSLEKQIDHLSSFKIPEGTFIKDTGEFYADPNSEKMWIELNDRVPSFEIMSSLEILKMKEGWICVKGAIDKKKKRLLVDLEGLRKGKEARIFLENFSFSEEDMNALRSIWIELEQNERVRLYATNYLPEEGFLNLLAIVFWRPEFLGEVEVNFHKSNVSDNTLRIFFQRVLSQMGSLKKLNLDLRKTCVSEKSLQALAELLLSSLKGLQEFRLNLAETKISEDIATKIFSSIPNVNTLLLGLGATATTNSSLESFVNSCLSRLSELRSLELGVWGTEVTDEGVIQLLMNIPSVQELRLGFKNTKISDPSMEVLKSRLNGFQGVEEFAINLDGTWVSAEMKSSIEELTKRKV